VEVEEAAEALELVVVGAGPQALALVLRLLDDAPDNSGDFFVGLGSAPRGPRQSLADLEKKRCSEARARAILARVLVVDEGGRWLGRWDEQFGALEIPHLRSTYDQHPCPYDSFALQQFAAKFGREREVVDLDASVHAAQDRGGDDGCDCNVRKGAGSGFRGSFRLPSTQLFRDFVDHLIDQYPGVRGAVRKARVARVERLGADLARVVFADGSSRLSRRVVLAVGPSAAPQLPDWALDLPAAVHALDVVAKLANANRDQVNSWGPRDQTQAAAAAAAEGEGGEPSGSEPSSSEPSGGEPLGSVLGRDARLCIVGGGLTSAHLALVAERQFGARVTLIARRRRLRVSQYDLDLRWLGWRTRPAKIASYLSRRTSPAARLAMLRAARQGGSVSPEGKRALDASRVQLVEDQTILGAESDEHGHYLEAAHGERLGPFDAVWFATGGAPGVAGSPLYAQLLAQRPIALEGGLPVLHASLRWDRDTPIYVVGAAAALTLGPDALNLAGNRMAAARLCAVFRHTLRERCLANLTPLDAAATELARATRLEELVVVYAPAKGTIGVRCRPGDAQKGTVRQHVQKRAATAKRDKQRPLSPSSVSTTPAACARACPCAAATHPTQADSATASGPAAVGLL